MLHTGDIKVVDIMVTMKVKGKVHTIEVHPDQWEKHEDQIRSYIAGDDIEIYDPGLGWCHVGNPQWHINMEYRVATIKPKSGQIWKNTLGNYFLYSVINGMISLETGCIYPDFELEDLTFVCDNYTQIPR